LGAETFWIVTGQAIGVIGGLVGVRVLTGILPPETYGEVALGMTVALLGQQLLFGPLGAAVTRFFAPAREEHELPSFLGACRVLFRKASMAAVALGTAIALGLFLLGQTEFLLVALIAVLLSIATGGNSILSAIQGAARQRMIVAWHQGLAQWLRFSLAVIAVWLVGSFSAAVLLGYLASICVVLFSQFFFLQRLIKPQIGAGRQREEADSSEYASRIWSFGWPFAAWGLFTWCQLASDRWAIQHFASPSAVGHYQVLYQLGYAPILLASGAVNQLFSPILYSRAGDASDKTRLGGVLRLNRMIVLAIALLTVAGGLLAQSTYSMILRIFVDQRYRDVGNLLPLMVVAGGVRATAETASLAPTISNKTVSLLRPRVCMAITGTTLNIVAAWQWGVAGVVFALIAQQGLYLAWMLVIATRIRIADGSDQMLDTTD